MATEAHQYFILKYSVLLVLVLWLNRFLNKTYLGTQRSVLVSLFNTLSWEFEHFSTFIYIFSNQFISFNQFITFKGTVGYEAIEKLANPKLRVTLTGLRPFMVCKNWKFSRPLQISGSLGFFPLGKETSGFILLFKIPRYESQYYAHYCLNPPPLPHPPQE